MEQVRDYSRCGGAVAEVARGISGRDQAHGPAGRFHAFTPRPSGERTYVPEVVAAIEARRACFRRQALPVKGPSALRAQGGLRRLRRTRALGMGGAGRQVIAQ
ncbi:MAG: hypothetical protein IPM40_20295 [Gammaproteobacteria bacterium]|nr:hypothetical protein [Gammaproteobacteria bacterium]